ncbi:hypothetical protein NQ317_005837, partial [Molorchus minor]
MHNAAIFQYPRDISVTSRDIERGRMIIKMRELPKKMPLDSRHFDPGNVYLNKSLSYAGTFFNERVAEGGDLWRFKVKLTPGTGRRGKACPYSSRNVPEGSIASPPGEKDLYWGLRTGYKKILIYLSKSIEYANLYFQNKLLLRKRNEREGQSVEYY